MNAFLLLLAAFTQTFPVSGIATPTTKVTGTIIWTQPWQTSRVDVQGVDGFNGTDKTGPALLFMPGAADGLVLGAGDPYRATGGKIERVRVVRKGTGGAAIKITAKSAAGRPGELIIRDVLTCGLNDLQGGTPDNWDTGLLIDGGDLTEVNAAGIRRVRIERFRAASCLSDSIVLRNCVHLSADDVQIDRGTAKRDSPTMVIENCQHANFGKLNLFGELQLRGSTNVVIDGYVQTLRVDGNCRGVNVRATCGAVHVDAGAEVVLLCSVRK